MGSESSAIQAIDAVLRPALGINYCIVAAFAVLLFDRCLRMEQEVNHIWRRRYSLASALYILLQAVTISFFALTVAQDLVELDCDKAYPENIALIVSSVLYDVTLGVISSLRVYAVNRQGLIIAAVVFMLSLVPVADQMFVAATSVAFPTPPPVGCTIGSRTSPHTSDQSVYATADAAITAADVIVVIVTWHNTYHTVQLARSVNISTPFSIILLRDGTFYFVLITVMNILNVVFYFTEGFGGFSYFRTSFTSIILSRFFLNLRETSMVAISTSPTQLSQPDMHFPRGVGSLGGSLAFMHDDDDEQDPDPDVDTDEIPVDEGLDEESRVRCVLNFRDTIAPAAGLV